MGDFVSVITSVDVGREQPRLSATIRVEKSQAESCATTGRSSGYAGPKKLKTYDAFMGALWLIRIASCARILRSYLSTLKPVLLQAVVAVESANNISIIAGS